MTEGLHRQRMLEFFDVLYSGDVEGALACCTDDVEFLANAPVDILPHMGHRRGKAEMREMWTAVAARYSEMRCEVPTLVVEGDKVAANIRVFFRKNTSRRADQPHQGNHRYFRPGRATARARRRRDSDRAKVERDLAPRSSSFRDGPKDQTSDAQLRIGESRDSQVRNCAP